MADTGTDTAESPLGRQLGVLLGFAEPAEVGPVAARLGLPTLAPAAGRDGTDAEYGRREAVRVLTAAANWWIPSAVQPSMLVWLLERDDPELNAAVIGQVRLADGIKRDILHGVPFGAAPPRPGARALPTLPVTAKKPWGFELDYPDFSHLGYDDGPGAVGGSDGLGENGEPVGSASGGSGTFDEPGGSGASAGSGTAEAAAQLAASDPRGLIAALRRAGKADRIKPARAIAAQVSRADWEPIAAADRDLPLSGYVRWALSSRPDCPDWLREQFGSLQPRFAKRMRKAGIIRDLTHLLTEEYPAHLALEFLSFGRWAFRGRIGEVEETISGLVRTELGGNVEAWAVFAQLLPGFAGSLPDLLVTAGAIAHTG